MQSQIVKLSEMGIVDTSFVALEATPISANTHQNNPKFFTRNKFVKDNQTKSNIDCVLCVHTAFNQQNIIYFIVKQSRHKYDIIDKLLFNKYRINFNIK